MKKILKFLKNTLCILLLVGIVFSLITLSKGYDMYKDAIAKVSIEEKVKSIKAEENYLSIKDIPKDFVNAVVSIEDKRFYTHSGIDIISLGRAIITNFEDMKLTEGGSTITQQLAKNMYFTQEKKVTRKIAEVFVASNLEKKYSKDEIFELYANVIYFGDGYYGIKEASNGYFLKEPIELTLDQITILAGIPNAPSVYALSINPELAKKRQSLVIDAMYENKYLDVTQVDSLKNDL
ncbi:MAG: biosynthetic peptidoglycan transglycosylase [Clostridia bacterium]